MDLGFANLKDILAVVVIPITIFAVGALLPRWFEAVKARKFLALIQRELGEMEPRPKKRREDGGKWHEHLRKRFIHEEIFKEVSVNRDFILSLPPDVAYNVAQLWSHFKKARTGNSENLAEHGASWCDYLRGLCAYFDSHSRSNYEESVYQPWRRLVLEYHPDAEATRRLQETCDGK
jgi:hypothetical protein